MDFYNGVASSSRSESNERLLNISIARGYKEWPKTGVLFVAALKVICSKLYNFYTAWLVYLVVSVLGG